MRMFRSTNEALSVLTFENNREKIGIGYPGLHNIYRFDWNDRHNEGVMTYLYMGGSACPRWRV